MNIFRKYQLDRHLSHFAAREKKKKVQACSVEQACCLGLIYTFESPQLLEQLMEALPLLKKNTQNSTVFCYLPKKINGLECEGVQFISRKDFNFWGDLKKAKSTAIQSQPFDILIDLNKESSPFTLYLLTKIEAKFLIGRSMEMQPYCNVVLSASEENYQFADYFRWIADCTNKIVGQ
jgi:hypothetical protein